MTKNELELRKCPYCRYLIPSDRLLCAYCGTMSPALWEKRVTDDWELDKSLDGKGLDRLAWSIANKIRHHDFRTYNKYEVLHDVAERADKIFLSKITIETQQTDVGMFFDQFIVFNLIVSGYSYRNTYQEAVREGCKLFVFEIGDLYRFVGHDGDAVTVFEITKMLHGKVMLAIKAEIQRERQHQMGRRKKEKERKELKEKLKLVQEAKLEAEYEQALDEYNMLSWWKRIIKRPPRKINGMKMSEEGFWEEHVVANSYQQEFVTPDRILELPFAHSFGKYKSHFTEKSRSHPALMNIELAEWIILRYTQPHWMICDPMAGVGTTPIVAALNRRNCIAFELEKEYANEIKANYEQVQTSCLAPLGKVMVRRYDARNIKDNSYWDKCSHFIMFSPPYLPDTSLRKKIRPQQDIERGYNQGAKCFRMRYSDNPMNIGNARPYKDYLQMMSDVYASCYSVLDDYSKMAIVVKNGVRNGKTVWLDNDTIKLCEGAGFILSERWWFKVQTAGFFVMENVKKWTQKNPNEKMHPYSVFEDILILEK